MDELGLAYEIGNSGETAVLMYADDLVIVCEDDEKLQKMIDRCSEIMVSIEMEANVAKCAVMDMKLSSNETTDTEFVWRGNGLDDPVKVDIKSEYKYLGVYFDDKLSWEKHIANITKKAYIAFARLRTYLCNRNIPVDMRCMAFNSLITPLFCYSSECWSNENRAETIKLGGIYNKLMKDCVRCLRKCKSETIHALTDLHSIDWWHKYFKLIFRHQNNDESIGSLHYDLMCEMDENGSNSRMRQWWKKNVARFEFHESLSRDEIIREMNDDFLKRKVKTFERLDKDLAAELLCDSSRLVESNWHPIRWHSNQEFSELCNVLGQCSGLTNGRYCYRCGSENSVMHVLNTCKDLHESEKVNLHKLLNTVEDSSAEIKKLHDIVRDHKRHSILSNCCMKLVDIYENQTDTTVLSLAPLIQDKKTYRILHIDGSLVTESKNLHKLHREGRIYVHPERVALKDYLT